MKWKYSFSPSLQKFNSWNWNRLKAWRSLITKGPVPSRWTKRRVWTLSQVESGNFKGPPNWIAVEIHFRIIFLEHLRKRIIIRAAKKEVSCTIKVQEQSMNICLRRQRAHLNPNLCSTRARPRPPGCQAIVTNISNPCRAQNSRCLQLVQSHKSMTCQKTIIRSLKPNWSIWTKQRIFRPF